MPLFRLHGGYEYRGVSQANFPRSDLTKPYYRLIAIMLGRLRMNIDDCISEYETLGEKVFGHSRYFHLRSPLFWPRNKYSAEALHNIIVDVVRRHVPKVAEFPGGRNFASDENRCRT